MFFTSTTTKELIKEIDGKEKGRVECRFCHKRFDNPSPRRTHEFRQLVVWYCYCGEGFRSRETLKRHWTAKLESERVRSHKHTSFFTTHLK